MRKQKFPIRAVASVITIAAIGSFVTVGAESASAYAHIGAKWRYASVTTHPHPGQYGSHNSAWNGAIADWDKMRDLAVRYSNSPAAQVTLTTAYRSDVSWDGLAQYRYSGGYFYNGSVGVLNSRYTQYYSYAKVRGVAVHEVGHLVGLAHVSNRYAVMYPATSGRIHNTPQVDDINGVNALY